MIGWIGAALIFVSCAAMGVLESWELKRNVRSLTEAVAIAERMRSEVCSWHLPLPRVLMDLQEAFPQSFHLAADTYQRLTDIPFSAYWRACLQASGLCQEAVLPLTTAGEAATRGEPPERVFDRCLEQLKEARESAIRKEKERGRLYAALGAAGGCLLVLILI